MSASPHLALLTYLCNFASNLRQFLGEIDDIARAHEGGGRMSDNPGKGLKSWKTLSISTLQS